MHLFSPLTCYFLAKTLPGTELSAVGVGHGDYLMRKWNKYTSTHITILWGKKNVCLKTGKT